MLGRIFQNMPPVVKNLIIINALFWVACVVVNNSFGVRIEQYLGLHYFGASDFKPWQFVTYLFLHDYTNMSLMHVFFNMFALFMFGRTLEQVWGPNRFLTYYIVTGVGAAVLQQTVLYFELRPMIAEFAVLLNNFPEGGVDVGDRMIQSRDALLSFRETVLNRYITVGASGSVFGILLAFGMLFPNTQIVLLFPPIPLKAKYFVMIYGAIELFMGFARFSGDNVAHFAHLGGMIFGYFMIKYWSKNQKQFY